MTMKTIQIDGMKGDLCVKEVDKALRELDGVEVKSVSVGSAVVECASTAACDACCEAIDDAGYTAHEPHAETMKATSTNPAKGAPTRESGNNERDARTTQSTPRVSSAQQPDPTRAGSPSSSPSNSPRDRASGDAAAGRR